MFVFDPLYFLYVGPFFLLAMWAQSQVKGTFRKYSQVRLRSNLSGREAAEAILRGAGIHDVKVEGVPGMLSDHYDPQAKAVRLSETVLQERNAAAVAVAAHECGHAIQHAQNYQPMFWRSSLVPVVNAINTMAMPMFLVGMFLLKSEEFALIGVVMYGAATLFHMVTLPVEFDASRRAIQIVEKSGMAVGEELTAVRKTLYAAGFTYLAATLVALAELVYWLLRSGLLGGSNDE